MNKEVYRYIQERAQYIQGVHIFSREIRHSDQKSIIPLFKQGASEAVGGRRNQYITNKKVTTNQRYDKQRTSITF